MRHLILALMALAMITASGAKADIAVALPYGIMVNNMADAWKHAGWEVTTKEVQANGARMTGKGPLPQSPKVIGTLSVFITGDETHTTFRLEAASVDGEDCPAWEIQRLEHAMLDGFLKVWTQKPEITK